MDVKQRISKFLADGQKRTNWLNQSIGDTLGYYLGPTGIPDRINAAGMLNPVQDIYEAGANARDGDYTGAAINTASALMPVVGAKLAGGGLADDAANIISDTLTNVGTKAQGAMNAGQAFAADEFGGVGPSKGIRAYHGSPHDFDRFSMDAIGTGEGAQDLGRGMHFYDEEAPAELYRNPAARWGDIAAMERYNEMGPGRVYEVNINARPDQILDVKTPAVDLPDGSRMAARRDAKIQAETDPEFRKVMQEHLRVQDIMNGAEQDMLADGFVGFKRKRFGGETEMSVFDENLIEIVRKYGIAGAAALTGMTAAEVEAQISSSEPLEAYLK